MTFWEENYKEEFLETFAEKIYKYVMVTSTTESLKRLMPSILCAVEQVYEDHKVLFDEILQDRFWISVESEEKPTHRLHFILSGTASSSKVIMSISLGDCAVSDLASVDVEVYSHLGTYLGLAEEQKRQEDECEAPLEMSKEWPYVADPWDTMRGSPEPELTQEEKMAKLERMLPEVLALFKAIREGD